ncbi:hypothetical protein L596_002487 [Steinernema carpocapsae]|uniref:Uncharacterized protein n=1 Tax=Steinernema carpocapsae TaxID=34508 RepID=A0A4U8UPB7_STECR|nr:hypothetical protein L596_002487 [Steinernema carpocapsae]
MTADGRNSALSAINWRGVPSPYRKIHSADFPQVASDTLASAPLLQSLFSFLSNKLFFFLFILGLKRENGANRTKSRLYNWEKLEHGS